MAGEVSREGYELLTPREQEVLELLREGMTNPQIAARLGISLDGAKYHVSQVLSKLGVSSRQKAARWRPERPSRWIPALAPVAFLWRNQSLGWLSPVIVIGLASVLVTGATLLVWGLVRTQEPGHDTPSLFAPTSAQTATPASPPEELAWEGGDLDLASVYPGTCGDEATAQAYGVPAMLRTSGGGLLGLEPEPYEYVPAQVNKFGAYQRTPEGWEVSQRGMSVSRMSGPPPEGVLPRLGELFLRRLDRPTVLFRYLAGLCNQEDGSPAAPTSVFPPAGRAIQLPIDSPRITEYRDGDYLSAQGAVENYAPAEDMRLVWAELGTAFDFANSDQEFSVVVSTGHIPELEPQADVVRWAILLAVGDQLGPKRPGQEYGLIIRIDAITGRMMGLACCYELVGG